MKKILTLFFAILLGSFVFSQNMSVSSFRCLENDINARTSKVTDQNGELCALIIVNTGVQGLEFTGCSIETTKQKTGAVWVFVSPGVKFITIMHRDLGQLRNYPFPESIKSGTTYEMVLKTEPKQPTLDSASMMKAMEQRFLELEQRLSQNNQQQNTIQQANNYSQPIIKNNISNFKLLKSSDRDYSYVFSVAFSPDGERIVSGELNIIKNRRRGTIKISSANTGACFKTLEGHSDFVNSASFSPDGKKIVSGSCDSTIKIWVVNTGKCLKTLEGHSGSVKSVSYSPDGEKIVSGSEDQTIKIWDANTGQCLETLKGHSSTVSSVAYSPDGKKIVSGSGDHTIKIWDANTGQCLKTLEGHSYFVNSVAYSPDGTKIISGSYDSYIKIWDANIGECLQTLKGHSDSVASVAYSPDGTKIVSGSSDRTIKIWGEE